MKASKLIEELQNEIEAHGDFEIYEPIWNRYDAYYEGLSEHEFSVTFYNKQQLMEREAEYTEGMVEKYRHPDRWIYDGMKDGDVVAIIDT